MTSTLTIFDAPTFLEIKTMNEMGFCYIILFAGVEERYHVSNVPNYGYENFIIIITTRSYAALRAADLDWIIRPGYSLGVFSTSRFVPPALSSDYSFVF